MATQYHDEITKKIESLRNYNPFLKLPANNLQVIGEVQEED